MATIIHENQIYHGIILHKFNGGFIFGFRVGGRNYEWNCRYDYWRLIEED